MPPVLNPFLRAFFRSALPSQCAPPQHHVLLVPTTEALLGARDKDSGAPYADLAGSEEFLASHVLRVPGGVGPDNHVRDASSFRETRGKAKQFTTANGRTVIVKDAFVYSNKGFKTLNQAQLLADAVFYPDAFEAQPWLVYYISRPLIGTFEPTPMVAAALLSPRPVAPAAPPAAASGAARGAAMPRKKEVRSFGDLLGHFPMIARQMQPGLERLFREFAKELEKPLPPTPTPSRRSSQSQSAQSQRLQSQRLQSQSAQSQSSQRRGSVSSVDTATSRPLSMHSNTSQAPSGFVSTLEIGDDEDAMRNSLETAVTAAIDLFQMVDKQQLSLLGATTDLTGPLVERMIERYVAEQVHHTLLFPRICHIRRLDDVDLERHMRHMQDVDISQVGIDIGNGSKGKQELAVRLARAVDMFKKMGVAGSPQEMLDIVLAVTKHVTMPDTKHDTKHATEHDTRHDTEHATVPDTKHATEHATKHATKHATVPDTKHDTEHATRHDASLVANDPTAQGTLNGPQLSEKPDHLLTINADTLVSLLLVVVIRAPVRHLQARLSYMRHFIFIDDVETGEMGYALSTFEAVLSYLQHDSGGLRKASRRNRKLWEATQSGDLATMQRILEPDRSFHEAMNDSSSEDEVPERHHPVRFASFSNPNSLASSSANGDCEPRRRRRRSPSSRRSTNEDGPLAHIFPFQRAQTPTLPGRPELKKTVSYDTRSMSSCSARSFRSRTTVDSRYSAMEGDTSIEKLVMTQGTDGDSVLMMAIESKQDKALHYLLSLTEYYTPAFVFDDCNNEGTTLLSVAVQLAHAKSTDTLLAYILENSTSPEALAAYFSKKDSKGRCMAHYLFHQPRLIQRIGHVVPWRLKDNNGQTPVFALCRSYDHDEYHSMVDQALLAATAAQEDNQPLHLDEHVDAKGNSLLHVITDPQLANKLLYRCDSDANATNDKQFTPLMVASKYGRTDMVRVLFQDPRVDLSVRDARGLTAVELAKDDEVRNRIDDLVLLSNEPGADGRITTVVRSFFVEDGTVRLVLKSGAPNPNGTITVTTCRRSSHDFENLAKWLAQENPASWLPVLANMPSPYLIPSRPSRSVLRDLQLRLDAFLKILLRHPTFSMHEMVWEFFLVPDIDSAMLAQRSARKAELRVERLREEFAPIYDVREVELFVQHARENVRSLHHASKSVLRRTNRVRMVTSDLVDAAKLATTAVHTLTFLPSAHLAAFQRYTKCIAASEASPIAAFYYNMHAISSTIAAVLSSLARPSSLIAQMGATQKAIDRHNLSVRRSDRWPLGLLDDARSRVQRDAQEKMDRCVAELADLGRELRYTQTVVASELASWHERRVEMGRAAVRDLARRMVVTERARLESMRRAVRGLGGRRDAGRANGVGNESGGSARRTFDYVGDAEDDESRHTEDDESGHAEDDESGHAEDDESGHDASGSEMNAVALPPPDALPVEHLVADPASAPEPDDDEETPLLDLAAAAPEQLDGTPDTRPGM